ncbi:MAG: hypothetical protein PHV25_01645 [Candidatus Pacebacteria bacterium]|nr:hypothetical protein [Candidatus Paceibacterota bacterium]
MKDNNIIKGFLIFSFVFLLGFSFVLVYYANNYVFSNNDFYQSSIDINEIRDKMDSMNEEEITEAIQEIERELNRLKFGN